MPSFVIKQIATPDPMLEGTEEALSRAINTSNRNFDVVKRLLYGQVDSVNIRENSIQADRMDVNDLTAITATFSELKAGSTFDYMYLYSAEGKPYIDIFSDDTKTRGGDGYWHTFRFCNYPMANKTYVNRS